MREYLEYKNLAIFKLDKDKYVKRKEYILKKLENRDKSEEKEVKIAGENALKPNLSNHIKFIIFEDSQLIYYFKKYDIYVVVGNYSKNSDNENLNDFISKIENNDTSINSEKLKLLGKVILKFYKNMINEFQGKISNLNIDYCKEYSNEDLNKVENVYNEIVDFFINVYYKYPLNEDNQSSIEIEEALKKYNIDDEVSELERKLSIIKNIIEMKIQKKSESKREKWNIIFTIIGIILALLQVLQGIF